MQWEAPGWNASPPCCPVNTFVWTAISVTASGIPAVLRFCYAVLRFYPSPSVCTTHFACFSSVCWERVGIFLTRLDMSKQVLLLLLSTAGHQFHHHAARWDERRTQNHSCCPDSSIPFRDPCIGMGGAAFPSAWWWEGGRGSAQKSPVWRWPHCSSTGRSMS